MDLRSAIRSGRVPPGGGQLRDIASILANADPKDRRAVYDALGVTLTYHPDARTVRVGTGAPHVLRVCVGGPTRTIPYRPLAAPGLSCGGTCEGRGT